MLIKDSKILITGAAGSIGSVLARKIAEYNPSKLLLLDQDETGIFEISEEIKNSEPFVADVTNRERINEIFMENEPDIVFHSAAYKHVPLMERQIKEAVRNNIFGTENVAEASIRNKVDKFIFISTDKAINPISVYGATKRIGEMICSSLNDKNKTKFISVRFGNVISSRGSVIPTFEKQIAKGGPITVTHPDMERYFMSMEEAIDLIIKAAKLGKGGEIFILDMGKQIKIIDLAKKMITESGKNIEIVFTEPRPGEKLSEELLNGTEIPTEYEKIFIAKLPEINKNRLRKGLIKLKQGFEIKAILKDLVPEYGRAI